MIIEGKITDTKISGNDWVNTHYITSRLKSAIGNKKRPFNIKTLEESLKLIKQKKIIKKKKIRKNGKAVLTINTSPSSAKIRILNIGPRYSKGLELKPGRYHVDVSKSGYKSIRKWVVLGKEDKTISIALKK